MPASPTSMPGARRSASPPNRPACSTATTPASCGPAARSTSRRQDRLAAINERLASLGTQFGQNVLADEKAYALMLEEGDLAGLPDFARAAARAAAAERGQPGQYAITLARSSCESFLQFSSRRDLREKVFQAWIKRGENGGATDNRALIAEMVALRAERAKLLGFETFADYRLDDQMAKTPQAARKLLDEVWGRARAKAEAERDALQAMIAQEGGNFALAPHDWRYYAEKLRKAQVRSRRSRDQAVLPARQDDRGRLRDRAAAVRPHLHAGRPCRSITRTPAPGT